MKGHEHLIALRHAGKVPKIVFINDFPCQTDWFEHDDHVTICTAGNAISGLDMRFLLDLRVSIMSESESRAKSLFAKAKWFGAKTVAACHVQNTYPHLQTGWTEIYQEGANA
ncbi:MAG: hypothetical protein KGI54_08840 [Pseudomonadota bacterium]|nr:hypothetical protein [Pseudomonadota bacterium]